MEVSKSGTPCIFMSIPTSIIIIIIIHTYNITGYSLTSSGLGNDPQFLLPLPNGDHMYFSIQGQPNFAFSLISDKYIKLNAQFVLPAIEEGHTISNVSTFIGDLDLVERLEISKFLNKIIVLHLGAV